MKHLLKVFVLSFLGLGLFLSDMPQAEAGSRHKRAMSSRARARNTARKVQRARINARIRHKHAVRRAKSRHRAAVRRANNRARVVARRRAVRRVAVRRAVRRAAVRRAVVRRAAVRRAVVRRSRR